MIDLRDGRAYIERFLKIRTKDSKLIPFRLNKPQQKLMRAVETQRKKGKPVRIIILKARQMGFSTLVGGLIFADTATRFNADSLIIAHKEEATANLYRMHKLFLQNLPAEITPMVRNSNAQEIVFDAPAKLAELGKRGLNSRIRCATAGGTGQGRSYTLKNVHMSEYAFWPGEKNETFAGIMAAVPDTRDTAVFIESTANGYDDFKEKWGRAVEMERSGEDGWTPVFFPWYEMEEYRRKAPRGFRLTDEEEEIKRTFRLDRKQMAWRRWAIDNLCGGDINLFRQEYPATPEEAFIATGVCAFDKEKLALRLQQVRQEEKWERGRFAYEMEDGIGGESSFRRIVSWKWVPEKSGPVRIRRMPEKGRPYVIGGDTAGTGSDRFTAQALDNITGEQVAALCHRTDETFYARQLYCLGRLYNDALVGVEINYSTYPEKLLEALGYPRLYVRERFDTYTGKRMEAFGWETTQQTRPVIVDGLKNVVRDSIECLCDEETIEEMLTFVYDEKWKPQAEAGKHDDLVLALAIAHQLRPSQRFTVDGAGGGGGAKWRSDQWEDYRRATEEQRAHMRKEWGDPR